MKRENCQDCGIWIGHRGTTAKRCLECAGVFTLLRSRFARYGLTPQGFLDIAKQQNGRCPGCQCKLKLHDSYSAVVDHDHATGEVRGILCITCNYALGNAKDNPKILQALIKYLDK